MTLLNLKDVFPKIKQLFNICFIFVFFMLANFIFSSTVFAETAKIGNQTFQIYPITFDQENKPIIEVKVPKSTLKYVSRLYQHNNGELVTNGRLIIGYVVGNHLTQGLLTDNIIFTCGSQECNPTGKTVITINKNTNSYAVKADDIEDWFIIVNQLKNDPNVKSFNLSVIADQKHKGAVPVVKGAKDKEIF